MASTLSLLTLHSLLDAAIAPQRGTAASDHLAATIVPLAVVALIASTYPRLRSGARAAVAACLGTWCLVGASLAVADARATFERASDWTGFLLAPAGLALLALAIGLALSTRKGGRYRYLRRAGVTFGALVIAYWLVVPVSIGLIGTHRPRAAAAEMPVGYHSVSLRTTDGLHLAAWYAPSQNGAAVISFPTRSGKLDHARCFAAMDTACSWSTCVDTTNQKGARTPSDGLRRRTSMLPFHGCATSPIFGRDASAESASPSVAR